VDKPLVESLCFHPDNAGVVRALGAAVVVLAIAVLAWELRDVLAGGGIRWRRIGGAAVGLAVFSAAFLLVTRSGTRITVDLDRRVVREEARIGGLPQVRELPFTAFEAVTVTLSYTEWESYSTPKAGMGSSRHVSPVVTWRLALDGAEHVALEIYQSVRGAEGKAMERARAWGLRAERRDYQVGPLTADELASFREMRTQTVPRGEPLPGLSGPLVGSFRIRAVSGESQPISPRDWPDDSARTTRIVVPKRG